MYDNQIVLAYLQSGLTTPEEEESYQAAEYDAMFNSDDSESYAAYATVSDASSDDVVLQLKVNNRLLSMILILVFIFMFVRLFRSVGSFVTNTLFKYL